VEDRRGRAQGLPQGFDGLEVLLHGHAGLGSTQGLQEAAEVPAEESVGTGDGKAIERLSHGCLPMLVLSPGCCDVNP